MLTGPSVRNVRPQCWLEVCREEGCEWPRARATDPTGTFGSELCSVHLIELDESQEMLKKTAGGDEQEANLNVVSRAAAESIKEKIGIYQSSGTATRDRSTAAWRRSSFTT